MYFLSIQLLLVFLSSVIQLLFVIRAFVLQLMLVVPLLVVIVTFPFVIQLLVTSLSSHPAAFHTSVIHMFVTSLPSFIQLLVTS
jgi:hypothetical protein